MTKIVPVPRSPIADAAGRITAEWYRYFYKNVAVPAAASQTGGVDASVFSLVPPPGPPNIDDIVRQALALVPPAPAAKPGLVVSVTDYGAGGDGVMDDAPAINAALAAAAGKAAVYLPAPPIAYRLGSQVNVPSNSVLFGDGPTSLMKLGNGLTTHAIVIAASAANVTLRSFAIDGNKSGSPGAGMGIDAALGATDIWIDGVTAHDCAASGIYADTGVDRIRISNCRAYSNGLGGVALNDGVSHFVVRGCLSWLNGTTGIGLSGAATYGTIDGNVSWDNGQGPQVADAFTGYNADCRYLVISNNVAIGGGDNGIHFGGNNVVYSGNVVIGPAESGIVHRSKRVITSPGTIAVTNGSKTVTGSATQFTALQASYGGASLTGSGNSAITIAGTDRFIATIDSDTQITLRDAYPGTTASGQPYSLWGYVRSSDVSITGNTIEGFGATTPESAIWIDQVTGGSVSGNSSTTGTGVGIEMSDCRAVTVGANAMQDKSDALVIDGQTFDTSGTIAVTNGSPDVVGTGTSFITHAAPGAVFRVFNDSAIYTVLSVADDTHLTLTANYAGSTASGKSYAVACGPSVRCVVIGNALQNSTAGIVARAAQETVINGNMVAGNSGDGITTGAVNVAFANYYAGNLLIDNGASITADGLSDAVGLNFDGTAISAASEITLSGGLILSGLPTSSAGLPSGAVWNNSGVLNIV